MSETVGTQQEFNDAILGLEGAATGQYTITLTADIIDDAVIRGVAGVGLYAIDPLDVPGLTSAPPLNVVGDSINTTITVACFAEGTRIATVSGDVPVEQLTAGDLVVTYEGTALPVVWLGRRRIDCLRHPNPRAIWPVRVAAGAFGPGLPARNLYLSPDHALFVDNVLIPVKYLIDGRGIRQVQTTSVTYFHVELPEHAVLRAEGLPAESYLDNGDRANFENGGVVMRLHPGFGAVRWEAFGCAPLVVCGPTIDAVRNRLARRSQPQARRSGISAPRNMAQVAKCWPE